jgi:hypothetical protein
LIGTWGPQLCGGRSRTVRLGGRSRRQRQLDRKSHNANGALRGRRRDGTGERGSRRGRCLLATRRVRRGAAVAVRRGEQVRAAWHRRYESVSWGRRLVRSSGQLVRSREHIGAHVAHRRATRKGRCCRSWQHRRDGRPQAGRRRGRQRSLGKRDSYARLASRTFAGV